MTIRKALREPLMVPESRGAIWEDHLGNRGDIDLRASRGCISPPGAMGLGLVPMAPKAGGTQGSLALRSS